MPKFEMPKTDTSEPSENTRENPEHIPTQKEVLAIFEKLVGEAKYEEIRKLEDEQGLYL